MRLLVLRAGTASSFPFVTAEPKATCWGKCLALASVWMLFEETDSEIALEPELVFVCFGLGA